MLFSRIRIKKQVKLAIWALVLPVFIGFVEKKQHDRFCRDLHIRLDHNFEHYFINDEDIKDMLAGHAPGGRLTNLFQERSHAINLRSLEQTLDANPFVQRAEVSRNLDGGLRVDIEQINPIARVLWPNGEDLYVSQEGKLIPMSPHYTARVLLVEGPPKWPSVSLTQQPYTASLLQLLQYIYNDAFWRAQIAQVRVLPDGEVQLYPQVGRQTIELGAPEQLESKFKRLQIFYKKILPAKGWNTYRRINVKYENQIICE
ncbi:cell division protein FtsQ [Catalinimonas alkaloidigena]|uniref:Cell division protein FtsQ n=1 Tax=Catalinimonas alkaloidigena TaxID=1075417 RepID=A0A1G9JAP6_9BACT|nr:cell division protein FtsQ/DivIB [Catalinimonas alkaloidigena]SDL34214.1 cell division protein FtsQ [Catalinimonas alkaloidigena]